MGGQGLVLGSQTALLVADIAYSDPSMVSTY